HHIVESSSQSADFVVAVNIDVLIEVARIADFASDGDEMRQRFGDGLGGPDGDKSSGDKGEQGSTDGHESADSTRGVRRLGGLIEKLGDIGIALIQNDRILR